MPLDHSKSPSAFKVETLAYVAGLFDGEGCVNFTRSGQAKTLVVRSMIRNTDSGIVQYLKATFGGRIEAAVHRDHPDWKPSFCWRLDGAAAVEFLNLIAPWVRIKQEQIFLASLYDAVRNRNTARPDQAYREMLALLERQLKWLNRKGQRKEDDIEPIAACLATLAVPAEQILSEAGYATH